MFKIINRNSSNNQQKKIIFSTLLIGSLLGLLASFVLSIEAIHLAKNSSATLPCDLSSVFSCGTVGRHATSQILGFPNSFIGLVTIPVMTTIAVLGLARVNLPKWFMRAAFLGSVAGLGFALWMFLVSFYVIQALCPWCLTMDFGMLLMFFALCRYVIREGLFGYSNGLMKALQKSVSNNYDLVVFITIVVITVSMILIKYGQDIFV